MTTNTERSGGRNETTNDVLKWVAGIFAIIIASGFIWKATSLETDLRSFAVDIKELQVTMTIQKEAFNSLAFQVSELQRTLMNNQMAGSGTRVASR